MIKCKQTRFLTHCAHPNTGQERQEHGGGERHLNTANTHQANQPLMRNLLYFRQSLKDKHELRVAIYLYILQMFLIPDFHYS
jgi:hypothetical protein